MARTGGTDPRAASADVDAVELEGADRWLFGAFSALLAVALVLDQLWWGGFELVSLHALVVLTAFWVLASPTSVVRFTTMIATTVLSVTIDMPFVGSHRLFALIIGGAVLAQLATTTLASRRKVLPSELFTEIAPFLRAAVVVLYGFAALAKLNSSFFDPATSCAVAMVPQLVWFDPSLLDARLLAAPAIWSTVLVEAALPILLAVRRTRLLGLALGAAFHTALALAGNVPYSALVLALYVAFLPADTLPRLRELAARARRPARGTPRTLSCTGPIPTRPAAAVAVTVLIGLWLIGAWQGTSTSAPGLLGAPTALVSAPVGDVSRALYVVIVVAGTVALVLSRLRAGHPPRYESPNLLPRSPILLGALLVIVVNGLCPYVGLKTDTSFEMFSGLRTEPGAWNHLIVPESARVFSYQDQLLGVIASNDPDLAARTAGGARVTGFEIERQLRAHPGATATVTSPAGPRMLGPLPAGPTVAERLATFRDVPPGGRARC